MTKLSVNVNKVATLRNARGGGVPNLLQFAKDAEQFGAQGITVHPRPDERHIRYADVYLLKEAVKTEFNIEGYPSEAFLRLVLDVHPHQVTLVPDPPEVLTSNAGWEVKKHRKQLVEVIGLLKKEGIRSSIFVDTDLENMARAAEIGTDRVELYTEPYAVAYAIERENAIAPFVAAAETAESLGLGLNAGHDLNLDNLSYFVQHIPGLLEVSIGHALISDALYLGLEHCIAAYLDCIK